MNDLPIEMKNGYILIKEIKNTTQSGIMIPDEKYNRFAQVLKTCANSKLKEGDIIVRPIGRETPIKLNNETYYAIREGFIFAKLVDED